MPAAGHSLPRKAAGMNATGAGPDTGPGSGPGAGSGRVVEADAPHILVVDDDRRLCDLLQRFLVDRGFIVDTAAGAAEARRKLESFAFDLLIVDVMMPGESGLSFTADLRRTSNVPVLMLSAMGETDDRIAGLERGADDYLPKPFEPRELLLRIRTVLRRRPAAPALVRRALAFGPYRFDLRRLELTCAGVRVRLTDTEARLLKVLADRAGEPVARETLGEEGGLAGSGRAIDVLIARLRRKVEAEPGDPRYLRTVRGKGYALMPD